MLGGYNELSDEQITLFKGYKNYLVEFEPVSRSNREKAGRREICEFVRRAYGQQIMTSTGGVVSLRLDSESFLITPTDKDRKLLDIGDIVLISGRKRERGKLPSRSVMLHDRIYQDHPEVNAIVSAQAPNATAFAVSGRPFDTRTIPESYIMLRDIPQIPYEQLYTDEGKISQQISADHPVLLLQNDSVLTVGKTLLQAFDRLEVAEFSARSLVDAIQLGGLAAINDEQIAEIERQFLGK